MTSMTNMTNMTSTIKSDVQIEDTWVKELAKSASADFKYKLMIQHLEVKTEFEHIPKDCEIAEMGTYFKKLSVFTLKDGRCLILRNNKEILVPENERNQMLGLAHAENHRGHEGMLNQLRGKVWWPCMAKQAHKMVNRCEPCQRLARANIQEEVEISHEKLFNTHPGQTIHVDYFEINNKNFLIMVDRLTGYVKCEMTSNKGTDAAISGIKNWGFIWFSL